MKLNRWQIQWFKNNLPKQQYTLANLSGHRYWYYFEKANPKSKNIIVDKDTYNKLPWYLRIC